MPNPENLTPFQVGNPGNPTGRGKGSKNRSTIARQILAMKGVLPADVLAKLREAFPDISDTMSIEEIMTLKQAVKAISKDDTPAYSAVMDSAYGKPVQEIEQDITSRGESLAPTKIVFTKGVKGGE